MPRANTDDLIQKVKEQQANLAAKMQRLQARKSQEARKRELREVILTGRMTLDRVKRGALTRAQYIADMDRFLTAPRDREFFKLPPRPAATEGEGEEHS